MSGPIAPPGLDILDMLRPAERAEIELAAAAEPGAEVHPPGLEVAGRGAGGGKSHEEPRKRRCVDEPGGAEQPDGRHEADVSAATCRAISAGPMLQTPGW